MWHLRNLQIALSGAQTLRVSQESLKYLRSSTVCFDQTKRNQHFRHPARVIMPDSENPLKSEQIIELNRKGISVDSVDEASAGKSGRRGLVRSRDRSRTKLTNSEVIESVSPPSDAPKPFHRPKHINEIDRNKISKIAQKSTFVLGKANDEVFTDAGEVIYTKLINKDPILSQLMIKLKSKKERGSSGLIMVEGWRLVADGLKAGCDLKTLVVSHADHLEKFKTILPKKGVRIYKMPYKEIQMWSDLETSPGIVGIFTTPKYPLNNVLQTIPINIICDNIRDPGNLGAVMRMADGVGCQQILLTAGCVDLWEPKVIRSAAGAHFRLNIRPDLFWNDIKRVLPENSKIFIADNKSTDDTVHIKNEKSKYSFTFNDRIQNSNSDSDPKKENEIIDLTIPIVPYYDVNYGEFESVSIIIGGETEGLSNECYRFGHERNGIRVNIPLKDGVDSLNTGMALAVVVFEVKRQLMRASTIVKKET